MFSNGKMKGPLPRLTPLLRAEGVRVAGSWLLATVVTNAAVRKAGVDTFQWLCNIWKLWVKTGRADTDYNGI